MDNIGKVGNIDLDKDTIHPQVLEQEQEQERTQERTQERIQERIQERVQERVQDKVQDKVQEQQTLEQEQPQHEEQPQEEQPQEQQREQQQNYNDTVISQCEKDEYLVKTIDWKDKKIRIITQNENGPCPLVAISNVLFLRGDLDIQPPDRGVVSFDYLVDRLGDYLLNHAPAEEQETSSRIEHLMNYRHNLDTALSILPSLKTGLDVNVQFDSIHGFEPTAELAMFDLFNVDLVHGWVADPQDIETFEIVVSKCKSYNQTVECIVQANEISSRIEQEPLTLAEEEKLHQGFIATEFLNNTATQLTYFGLELLLDSIPVNTLCVLFRNNHFSTVYRHPESGLYMLVTDSGLVLERSIIWESITDIDQGSSEFYNGHFKNPNNSKEDINTDLDYAIAISMQEVQQRQQEDPKRNSQMSSNRSSKTMKKKNEKCIIS